MPGDAAWDALADTAISMQLTKLVVSFTLLGPWCVPGLTRLLREGSISSLRLDGAFDNGPFVDAETEPVLFAALRANSTLTEITLICGGQWDEPAGIDFVDALVGHPTLQAITLQDTAEYDVETRVLAGAALGRLVAANSPALSDLTVSLCKLGDDGLRPLFAALPSNTYLFMLSAYCNGITAAFAPAVLASVTANESLASLNIDGRKERREDDRGYGEVSIAELHEAKALVLRRNGDYWVANLTWPARQNGAMAL